MDFSEFLLGLMFLILYLWSIILSFLLFGPFQVVKFDCEFMLMGVP
jgi:hypothetical protein